MKAVSKVMFFIMMVSPIFAANYWTGAGSNDLWTNPDNWSGTYPDTSNQLKLQGDEEVIEVIPGDDISCNRAIFIDGTSVTGGLDNTTTTINMTGGSVACTSYFRIGYFGIISTEPNEGAVLNMSGDAYFQIGTLELCWRNYAMTNITIADNARLYVTSSSTGLKFPASAVADPIARIWIKDNGVLETNALVMATGEDGFIDVSGDGALKVRGDVETSVIDPLIADGMITTDGGVTTPTVIYDGTWTWVMSPNNSSLAKPNTPTPADGAATYTIVDLSWIPGNVSNTWDVYVGTDPCNLTLMQSGLTSPEYMLSCLDFETTYYWRVDEYTGATTVTGDIWSFTTREFVQLFWMEYTDQAALEAEWSADNSLIAVSNDPARGSASMVLVYDNTTAPYLSKAVSLDFPYDGDLACTSGVAMTVWIYEDAGNDDDPVFVSLTDSNNTAVVVENAVGITTQFGDWTIWRIDMRDFDGVDLGNVTSMTIGVGDPTNPSAGGTGTIYIDNVNMYPVTCVNSPASDLNGDCLVDLADFAQMASEWLVNGNFPIL